MKQVWAALALVAIVVFITAWPVYQWFKVKPVGAAVFDRTKRAVERNPQLQPDWDRALADGVLTWPEAKAILEKAGEKADPED
jgi:hypothetical protein